MSTDDRPPGISEAGQTLALFFAAHRVVEAALEAEVRERVGIGLGQFDVLNTIEQTPSRQLRMADIAERMCISRSGVTQSIDRLESLGFVSRVAHPQDRRTVLAEITPAGRAVVPEGREALEHVAARYLGNELSADESSALASALVRIAGSSTQQGADATDPSFSMPQDQTGADPRGTGQIATGARAVAASG